MIAAILTGIKVIKGFAKAWKVYIIIAALAGVLFTAWNYVDNHGAMKAELSANDVTIDELLLDVELLHAQIDTRNATIQSMNARRLEELAAAKIRLQLARDMVQDLQSQNENILEELKVTQFETLDAIRDDEDFADWVDWTVPSSGWSLLRKASEGSRD